MVERGAGQAAAVRGGVDAQRQARDDGQAGIAERLGERSRRCARPARVALRLPTIARQGRCSSSTRPAA